VLPEIDNQLSYMSVHTEHEKEYTNNREVISYSVTSVSMYDGISPSR
jgi:hypothetical protein